MIGVNVNHSRKKCKLRAPLVLLLAALTTMIPAGATMPSLCVRVEKDGVPWRSIRARSGSEARLSFQHSIYGSRVEEVFHLAPATFYLTEIRYAEPRLLEFYGHEAAEYESGAWVVRPRAAAISSLALHTSSATQMSMVLEQEQQSLRAVMPADSVLHVTIASCIDAHNG